jgi:hypothetical protein
LRCLGGAIAAFMLFVVILNETNLMSEQLSIRLTMDEIPEVLLEAENRVEKIYKYLPLTIGIVSIIAAFLWTWNVVYRNTSEQFWKR